MGEYLVGVDVGGTAIKIAFVSQTGEMVLKWEIPTNSEHAGQYIVSDISHSIRSQLQQLPNKANIIGIGIGAPGFINRNTGYIDEAVNIGWKNFDLKSNLETEMKVPVIVENDANMAALGEMWKGAGSGCKDLVCITLGTGVGGGIIINREIVHGISGMAGEIGHVIVNHDADDFCNCGKKGCLETIASATAIVKQAMNGLNEHKDSILYKSNLEHGSLTAKMVVAAVQAGDEYATKVFDRACFYLGIALANIATTINPSKIVLGGGVSKAGNLLLESVSKYFKQFSLPRIYTTTELALAALGNDAGVIGGAWLVQKYVRTLHND